MSIHCLSPNKLRFSWFFDCQVILVYNVVEYYVMRLWVLFISYGWYLGIKLPYTSMKHSLTDKGILLSIDYTNNVLHDEHHLSFWDCGIL